MLQIFVFGGHFRCFAHQKPVHKNFLQLAHAQNLLKKCTLHILGLQKTSLLVFE